MGTVKTHIAACIRLFNPSYLHAHSHSKHGHQMVDDEAHARSQLLGGAPVSASYKTRSLPVRALRSFCCSLTRPPGLLASLRTFSGKQAAPPKPGSRLLKSFAARVVLPMPPMPQSLSTCVIACRQINQLKGVGRSSQATHACLSTQPKKIKALSTATL